MLSLGHTQIRLLSGSKLLALHKVSTLSDGASQLSVDFLLTSLLTRPLSLSTFHKKQHNIDASRAKGGCQQAVTSSPLARVECQQLVLIQPSSSQPLVQACSSQSPHRVIHSCQVVSQL